MRGRVRWPVARFGHVQLTSWVSNTERAIITTADIAPSLGPPVRPEGATTAEPKGYQQITGWQVGGSPVTRRASRKPAFLACAEAMQRDA